MPRYFFHVYDGSTYLDDTGSCLTDFAHAKIEALNTAIAMLGDRESPVWGEPWRMDVADEKGTVLLQLNFDIAETQAA